MTPLQQPLFAHLPFRRGASNHTFYVKFGLFKRPYEEETFMSTENVLCENLSYISNYIAIITENQTDCSSKCKPAFRRHFLPRSLLTILGIGIFFLPIERESTYP